MEEQTRKEQLESALSESLKRAHNCSDPKDYLTFTQATSELSKQIENCEKLESEQIKMIEEKKDKKFKWLKDLSLATIPLLLVEGIRYICLERHTKRVIMFEKDGIWTTGTGKNVSNTTKFK